MTSPAQHESRPRQRAAPVATEKVSRTPTIFASHTFIIHALYFNIASTIHDAADHISIAAHITTSAKFLLFLDGDIAAHDTYCVPGWGAALLFAAWH